ncbi:XrtA/PEP-CTERM system TPR-repeat protein PrsT [Hydrogenophaga sp.]|uniref:XrtA/PEP-CTERM system TPR-repeat protein PrsT n=1 Tax=Hydrogenophaga sp. TaxID=1904254 RepID=UPI00356672AE
MTPPMSRFRVLAVAFSCAALLVACGGNDPEKMLSSARQYLEKKDAAAAIIQLKNVLQEKPDTAEARFLLGKALLQTGNAAGGETELQKAMDLGYAADEVAPLLASARLAQGRYKAVTDAFDALALTSDQARAELKTLVAVAWRLQGNNDAFLASLDLALKAQPDYAPARLEQALYKASRKDFDEALAILDSVLAKQPTQESALKMRGDVFLYGKHDADKALEAYRMAVTAQPEFRDGQAGIVRVLLSQNQLEEAAKEQAVLSKMAPGRPLTLYLQAQLAYQQKDFKLARDSAQQLLKMMPDSPSVMELAGTIEYQMGAWLQAETLLARALQAAPDLRIARRVLALTYLRVGQVSKAQATLPADLDLNDSDPGVLEVAGQTYLAAGDVEKAQRYFARAAELDPKDPGKQTSLAVTQLMSGKSEMAFGALQNIAANDTGVVADMALISAHMGRNEAGPALTATEALAQKRPKDPLTWQLMARAQMLGKDAVAARKSLEKALAIDPNYFPAINALSVLDVFEKKPQDAQKRFEEALKRQPDNTQVLLALAGVRSANGANADEVGTLIGKAVDAAPNDFVPRVALVEHHLRHRAEKLALSAAQSASTALPETPQVLDALGRAQLANGEHNQALSTFSKLARLQPTSPLPLMRMASVHTATKDYASAADALRKALALQPDLLLAQKGLAGLAVQGQRLPEALAISRAVQKQRPKEPVGFALEGDVQASAGNWSGAAQAYRAGYKLDASPELAIKLHSALSRSGGSAEAERLAAAFSKSHPENPAFSLYLGDRAMAASDWGAARRLYLRVIELQPRNALALNNLAWTSGQLNLQDAVGFAEKANAEVPNQPAFMDTLAMLLSKNGEHARATELQKKVVALKSDVPVFQLNLAKILINAGDKGAAKLALDALLAQKPRTPETEEAEKLKQGL